MCDLQYLSDVIWEDFEDYFCDEKIKTIVTMTKNDLRKISNGEDLTFRNHDGNEILVELEDDENNVTLESGVILVNGVDNTKANNNIEGEEYHPIKSSKLANEMQEMLKKTSRNKEED